MLKVNVLPSEAEEFGDTQTGGNRRHDHQLNPTRQISHQTPELVNSKDASFALPLFPLDDCPSGWIPAFPVTQSSAFVKMPDIRFLRVFRVAGRW